MSRALQEPIPIVSKGDFDRLSCNLYGCGLRRQSRANQFSGVAIRNGMEDGIKTTGVVDGLLEPDRSLVIATFVVFSNQFIFFCSPLVVRRCGWENQYEGQGRSGYHGEEVGIIDRKDILKREGTREPESVHQFREKYGVGLKWDKVFAVIHT